MQSVPLFIENMPQGIYIRKGTLEEKFWRRVKKTNTCWEWIGCKDTGGYGQFWNIHLQKLQKASRIIWVIQNGEIPNGLFVLHKCDNRICVNPNHLFLGTAKDNIQDMLKKGRGDYLKGEKNVSAKLTLKKVKIIRKLYKQSNLSQKDLAKKFNVHYRTIFDIVNGKTWKHML